MSLIHMQAMCGFAVLRVVIILTVRPVDVGNMTGGSTSTSCLGSVHILPALIPMKRKDTYNCIYIKSMAISPLFSVTMKLRMFNDGRTSPTKTKFEQHKKICGHQLKPYECPEEGCKGAYKNKFCLDNHMKTEHPQAHQDTLRFNCTICLKPLKSQQALKSHMALKHDG